MDIYTLKTDRISANLKKVFLYTQGKKKRVMSSSPRHAACWGCGL